MLLPARERLLLILPDSILIQPSGQMLHEGPTTNAWHYWFQSSSGSQARCYPGDTAPMSCYLSFNPHPTFRPDVT